MEELKNSFSRIIANGIQNNIALIVLEDGTVEETPFSYREIIISRCRNWRSSILEILYRCSINIETSCELSNSRYIRYSTVLNQLTCGEYPEKSDKDLISNWFSSAKPFISRIQNRMMDIGWKQENNNILLTGRQSGDWSTQFLFLQSGTWMDTLPDCYKLRFVPYYKVENKFDIPLHTPATIKGSEYDAAVTIGTGRSNHIRNSLYIAITRAKLHKELLISEDIIHYIPREFMDFLYKKY